MANEEFEKKTVFRNLTNIETKLIHYASMLGRGNTLSDRDKRLYYRYVKQQMGFIQTIKERGWLSDWQKVGKDIK